MRDSTEIDGLRVALEDTGGDGPTVLFVHGLGGSKNVWLAQLRACEEAGYRAIAYDQRGCGRSDKDEGPYSVELWAEDVEHVLDALGIERAALVGNSVGCMVVEHAAHRLGERIWALAVLGGALQWRPEAGPVFEERVKLARAGRMDEIAEMVATTGLSERCRSERPELLGLARELFAANDPAAYAACAEATAVAGMQNPGSLACPVLAFCGSEDPVAPPEAAAAIADAAPHGETASVEGAAHWCMLEDPQGVNAILVPFLQRAAP
jgi:3-oxoadipate enol-lactonase